MRRIISVLVVAAVLVATMAATPAFAGGNLSNGSNGSDNRGVAGSNLSNGSNGSDSPTTNGNQQIRNGSED